jgi:hypothetical protein
LKERVIYREVSERIGGDRVVEVMIVNAAEVLALGIDLP